MKLRKPVKIILIIIISLACIGIACPLALKYYNNTKKTPLVDNQSTTESKEEQPTTPNNNEEPSSNTEPLDPRIPSTTTDKSYTTKVSINAVGDCTIGTDTHFNYGNRDYLAVYKTKGAEWFLGDTKDIFEHDDLTILNLETTFTNADESYRVKKAFNFKAPPETVDVLTTSSVEVVNLANNHMYDYGEKGYNDTMSVLKNANIGYYGYDNYYVFEKNGVKIGMAGFYCAESTAAECKNKTLTAINALKAKNVDSIIMTYHWGIELDLSQNTDQEEVAHYAIDNGADLVLGHHPHNVQGIELYKDKYIVYSLGNWTFGGHINPTYFETFLFHIDFYYSGKEIVDSKIVIVPARVSSEEKPNNDFRPTIVDGAEKQKILDQIQKYSKNVTVNK